MTLHMAQENLRALQHEVVVAAVLGAQEQQQQHAWGDGGEGGGEGGAFLSLAAPQAMALGGGAGGDPCLSSSGKLLLWHLHQHGHIAPWTEAAEVRVAEGQGQGRAAEVG